MELNITHLQHYLAYGLRVQYEDKIYKLTGSFEKACSIEKGNTTCVPLITEIKPLLLPLSALYEEIDGEIGIVELAKICGIEIELNHAYEGHVFADTTQALYREEDWIFMFKDGEIGMFSFDDRFSGKEECIINLTSLSIFAYLFSHHYDVYDLCSKGLAIDKRSVK
ncbi:MAG: hypothetical protein KIC84_11525 [Dysgonomonas mossii]|uniref:hypothetical protein n=1 Tax=Dysgonomonas mossii TaxID=163665 RepID=UPI0026F35D68|nr:hypothetical protein [Dysgonomonas mossii]MBS5907844.1 hypothetical protein [Dysgonomonas mossii]